MAKVEDFPVITKANVTSNHVLYLVNQLSDTDHKFVLNTIFPTISNVGSAGQAIHNGLTNISQFNLRKLAAASTSSGALTATTHSDGHLLITLVEASLDLNNCNNSTSGFLSTVNLASNVGSTVLPVANGGTGLATITANSVLIGNGTSNVSTVDMSTKGHLLVGDGSGSPTTLAVGTNGYFLVADSTQASGIKWNQTLGVANGGTGANTLTANGALIGNGTGAVTSVDMSTKGHLLVGDGSGNPQALAVGANGYILTADSTAATGLAYLQTLPVANGGTGANTLTANGVLIGNGTGAITSIDLSTKGHILIGDGSGNPSALSVGSNGQRLVADSTAGNGVAWENNHLDLLDEFVMPSSTALDMNDNQIDLGTGYLSDNGQARGIRVTTTNAYIGINTNYFNNSALNIDGGIQLSNGARTIGMTASSGASGGLSIEGGESTGGNAGMTTVKGGDSSGGNGDGGDLNLVAGRANGSGTHGSIIFTTAAAEAMEIRTDQHVKVNKSIIFNAATEGIVYTSMGTVTQSTNHSTNVTVNSMAGVITLAAVSLASGAEAQFEVINSAAQLNSLILLTVDSPAIGSSTDDSAIIAQVTGKAAGAFKVILKNVGDAATDTNARKINFLIINPGV